MQRTPAAAHRKLFPPLRSRRDVCEIVVLVEHNVVQDDISLRPFSEGQPDRGVTTVQRGGQIDVQHR